ncbi:pectate lyase [Bacillus sp. M6-12]|uniref:glycosyl hydrolase family 28-related protein n=1 Tax=Bacillus sp. M6-12 TaxID=2054166 RepID=UPI000C760B2E|nr:glycosyl hydrolase family 28-related protein [Bacillus sp. M6-12]PLS18458.1 pectate lyase [Bacillus sp. M6-12]
MIYLDKKHDSANNRNLIAELVGDKRSEKEIVLETELLFQQNSTPAPVWEANSSTSTSAETSIFGRLKKVFGLFFSLKVNRIPTEAVPMDIYPKWKGQLDEEYNHLFSKIRRVVNVRDYGAVGDGVTDNTEAFRKAFGSGRVKVIVPAGVYITKGIRLPSWTCFIGTGKGATTIKLHNDAPKGRRLVTNAHHWKGNRNILVQGMTLDWNVERLGNAEKTSTFGNHSSCLTYANVSYGWVKDVEAINPGLHCFDISSTLYNYSGDGHRARGGSRYVWLDNLNGYGFGDDGITTHHSDDIIISNSHMSDPSGRAHAKGFSNSNGIEVDDGSRNVWLINNSTARCFGGVEIKAHHNSSAAANVHISGHLSVNDNRSYNFRHIGHHRMTDPESKTAYNIRASNIVAIAPVFTDLYADSTPRCMVVSAYRNVAINNFTLIGDPDYDYKGNPMIAIQYRARNITLNNVKIKDFKTAGNYIKVFGGDNRADDVKIQSVSSDKPGTRTIAIGKGIENISINKVLTV